MGFDKWKFLLTPNSDDGRPVFFSGTTLSGRVIIVQDKEKNVDGVYVQLKGYCKVKWTEDCGKEIYKSHEEYINEKVYILTSSDDNCKILPGTYEYPYKFYIPSYCPSSFEGKYGYIRYEIRLVMQREFLSNKVRDSYITVIAPLDLNPLPGVRDQIRLQVNKSYSSCCVDSGSVEALVKCPVSGYCPGQSIPIEVMCENNSSVTITNIYFVLQKVTTFYTTGQKYSTKVLAMAGVGPVPPRGALERRVALKVPEISAVNLRECKFIDVDFFFQVIVLPSGCHRSSTRTQAIIIGTIPLRNQLQPSDLPSQPPVSPSHPLVSPFQPPGSTFQPPGLPSPSNYLPFPPPNAVNNPYTNGNPYTSANPPYNPNFGPSTSYHVHPAYPDNADPAFTHQPPPPRYSVIDAPTAPEAEPDTNDNIKTKG